MRFRKNAPIMLPSFDDRSDRQPVANLRRSAQPQEQRNFRGVGTALSAADSISAPLPQKRSSLLRIAKKRDQVLSGIFACHLPRGSSSKTPKDVFRLYGCEPGITARRTWAQHR